ncbi:MAG: hypothetical protein KKE62_16550 [Proteobacteria bacterium]|nr:hypothetical protein [Pseudomonadota bacterium]MBU1389577.1 hypothetical protein [Pseudomonadota bacterium]MBU1544441.1 hypothetical protein [Pseudomonadota bacterium]MBU2431231.1 hypothetical protein [Pseudomonadota bacterium]MBU2481286.1 hypothetical protein [Pseudomonadota bacterium]
MTAQTIILIFTLVIYLIIIFVFNKARIKYAGGKVGKVINLILVTASLLFVADYVIIFDKFIAYDVLEIVRALFRTAALSFLAYGGSKISDS